MSLGQGQAGWGGKRHMDNTLCLLLQLAKPCGGAHHRAALLQLRRAQCQQYQADVAGLVQSQDPGLRGECHLLSSSPGPIALPLGNSPTLTARGHPELLIQLERWHGLLRLGPQLLP